MKIIFFGTAQIAAIELEYLVQNKYNIIAVVTNYDKPQGRGKTLMPSPVKVMAQNLGLTVFEPTNLKDPCFISSIKQLEPDIQIVVAFRMLPKDIYTIAKYGTFNMHTSLLPAYRGAAPINWAIINGEQQTGLTTFLLNDKIDCGEILLQEKIDIDPQMDFETLYNLMAQKGKRLIAETIQLLSTQNYTTIKQIGNSDKKAPKIFKPDTYINWYSSAESIRNFIRGLSPTPCAKAIFWDKLSEKTYEFKLYKAQIYSTQTLKQIGTFWIDNKKKILVQCNDGVLELIDLQLNGKKRMLSSELIKGLRITELVQKK